MINTIIKEEDDEEEENISEKDLSNPNTSILKSIKSESVLEESKYNQLNNGEPNPNKIEKYSDNSLSQYTEDILPKIYSKNKYREVNKTKTLILSSNLNLNEKDEEKRTILHRACLQLKLSIIKDLIPKLTPKYVNQLDKYGNSPLILACKYTTIKEINEREQILEILLNNGADVHCIEPINGWTALHWCCFNGDLNCVKLLINFGSNFFLPSKFGFFTIDLAGRKLFYDLVSFLLKTAINFLQKVGEYELLDIDTLLTDDIIISSKNNLFIENGNSENDKDNDEKNLNFVKMKSHQIEIEDNINGKNNVDYKFKNKKAFSSKIKPMKLGILTNMSDLPKINQTIYLRLFTEHCLYWACYFNYNEKIINMFLSLYNARSGFPLFCLDNQTSLHAACIQGSLIPFQLVYKTYEIKRNKKLIEKSDKKIPVTVIQNDENNNNIRRIAYPKEFKDFKKQFLSSEHFNSLNKKFRNYLENNFFELVYPQTLIETLPLNKIFDNKRNTPITLASKYNNQKFIEK